MNIKCLCCRRPKHSWDQKMAGSCWSIYLSICLGCDSLVTRWCMGRSVCGHRRLMDTSRNLHDPTIHSARRWQGWNVSCVNVANNDITIKQNAIMSCSYDNLHEPVYRSDIWHGLRRPRMFDNEDADQLSSHAFIFSYKLQLTSPPSTRQSPPSRTPCSGQRSQLWNEKTI